MKLRNILKITDLNTSNAKAWMTKKLLMNHSRLKKAKETWKLSVMPDCGLDPRLGGKNSTKVTNEAKAKARVL